MKLTIKERLQTSSLYPQGGNIISQQLVRDISEKVSIDQEEMKEIELRAEGDQLRWNDKIAKEKEVKFTKMEIDFLKKQVDRVEKEEKVTQSNLSLCEKIQDGVQKEK